MVNLLPGIQKTPFLDHFKNVMYEHHNVQAKRIPSREKKSVNQDTDL